jgi:subtilisin family serine protease
MKAILFQSVFLISSVVLGINSSLANTAGVEGAAGTASDNAAIETEGRHLPKITKYVLKQASENPRQSILVVLKDQYDVNALSFVKSTLQKRKLMYSSLANLAIVTQRPLVSWAKSQKLRFKQFYIYNMIQIDDVDLDQINQLSKRPEVEKIMGNPSFRANIPAVSRTHVFEQWLSGPEKGLENIGATRVWNELNVRGKGVVVASQDTGVQWTHPALIKQYRGYGRNTGVHDYNWRDSITSGNNKNSCGINLTEPCDDNSHGTHTTGTMVGDDGATNNVGVAPEAQWIGCRNMNDGYGTPGSYMDCFQFFLAPFPVGADPLRDGKPEYAPHVMNNSWGCPAEEGCKGREFEEILRRTKAAGIFVVAAAGNDGPGCATIKTQPSIYSDLVFTVGAHNHRNNQIAGFSSRGPSLLGGIGPDVTAPGVDIRSSVPTGEYGESFWSGTSMAAPHVAGTVALMWSANPKLKGLVDETSKILKQTAMATRSKSACGGTPGTSVPNNTFGYGRLDAYAAVKKAMEFQNKKSR